MSFLPRELSLGIKLRTLNKVLVKTHDEYFGTVELPLSLSWRTHAERMSSPDSPGVGYL